MEKEIIVPPYMYEIKKTNYNFPKRINLFACDIETVEGEPYTIQFYHNEIEDETYHEPIIKFVNEYTILNEFMSYINQYYNSKCVNVVFFHNLKFDLTAMLLNYYKNKDYEDLAKRTEFSIVTDNLSMTVYAGKIYWAVAKLLNRKKNSTFKIIDTGAILKGKLSTLSKTLNLPYKKLSIPEGLGSKRLLTEEFINYALNDVLVQYELAKRILFMCKEFNIKIPLSTAQMFQYVFTNQFLKEEEKIFLPYPNICRGCIKSYHGGKNMYYLNKPLMINDVYELDVNSMYPYAMLHLPPFTNAEYIHTKKLYINKEGVYRISGYVEKCKYPIICDTNFNYLSGQEIKNIFLSSYEIKEALRTHEVRITNLSGYIIQPSKTSRNPFIDYVNHFYKLKKETPNTDDFYIFYKNALNNLYGKFAQAIQQSTEKKEKDDKNLIDSDYEYDTKTDEIKEVPKIYKAGGLYNPMIASLITGYCRSYIHQIEHKYESLDTSTDSVKTIIKPDTTDISKEIGGLSVKGFGDCLFFRNKLYILFDNTIKSACHGFHVKPTEKRPYKPQEILLKMYITNQKKYDFTRMTLIKESMIQGIKPLVFKDFIGHNLNLDFD